MEALIKSKDGHKKVAMSRRKAVHEKCLNCTGWHPGKVANCALQECPLYPFRTGRGKQDPKLREKAIKEYCRWCAHGQVGEITKCPSNKCPLYIFRRGHQTGIKRKRLLRRRHGFHQPLQEQRL